MNKNNLALFNRIRRDTLVRLSDNVDTMSDYISRYYNTVLPTNDANAIYKALQTSIGKSKSKRAPVIANV